ncbi:MAG: acetate/propionate family kinase [Proteobacteria bacterium]|nr:acetate/propionate family kinase [Pseudomonadota bacterium]
MKILAINCGSSTLKFQLFEVERDDTSWGQEKRLARGIVEEIGTGSTMEFIAQSGGSLSEASPTADHGEASLRVLEWLESSGLVQPEGLAAVGHRVVHGGNRFTEATLLDDDVLEAIEAVGELAPLHNQPALRAIYAVREVLGLGVPMVAVFDTAFHRTLPKQASEYPIPPDLAQRHQIRRYGFHGIAHRYMTERYSALTATPIDELSILTVQLGNGCSVTAVRGGRSLDTSMGFTPLEGLMMGTRSGDIDPSIPGFLARREGVGFDEVESWLNKRSGLFGVSGRSRDMRELLELEQQGDLRAASAVEMFCYRVRKYVGAYLNVLGGADAVVFGGGIGENAASVRARICSRMEWCGLLLDRERNISTLGSEGRISRDEAKLHAYVIPVDETVIIARDTRSCLFGQKGQ